MEQSDSLFEVSPQPKVDQAQRCAPLTRAAEACHVLADTREKLPTGQVGILGFHCVTCGVNFGTAAREPGKSLARASFCLCVHLRVEPYLVIHDSG